VRHHGDERAVRARAQQFDRIALRDRRDVRGKLLRDRAGPRVDPGDGERQRRQRARSARADMPGAEQIERGRLLAEALAHATVGLIS
jgi:hypothetical protein